MSLRKERRKPEHNVFDGKEEEKTRTQCFD